MSKCISVIVPVFNTEKYLRRCVESIRSQTYSNLEIILVDDGSSDSSVKLCDDYCLIDERIKVVHKKNGGLSSARNSGINAATGDYIGFVDSDDYISGTMYESLLNAIKDNGRVLSNVMYKRVNENGVETPSCVPHNTTEFLSKEKYLKELLMHVGDVSVCTKLFPAHMIKKHRFNEEKLNEDLLFMIEMLPEFDGISYVGETGYYYYIRGNSISAAYGKSVRDMVGNSLVVHDILIRDYPHLSKMADRFVLVQHMGYLLLVPEKECIKSNELYCETLKYLRSEIFNNIFNNYLTTKNKFIMLGLALCPKIIRKLNHLKNHCSNT